MSADGSSKKQHYIDGFEFNYNQIRNIIRLIEDHGGLDCIKTAIDTLRRHEEQQEENTTTQTNKRAKKNKGSPKEFDFDRFATRHIALQLYYDGDRYSGFASQGDGEDTVEAHLISALMKTKLIKDRNWACYSRCGRTDKGVSALRQVVGLRVRSARKRMEVEEEEPSVVESQLTNQDIWEQDYEKWTENELDYCGVLNRVLPSDIRAVGWAPTPQGFSARFCASNRTYRYFFDAAGLNIPLMQESCERLVGDHDYRNFCKMDATAVQSFRRVINYAKIYAVAMWQWQADDEDDDSLINVGGSDKLWMTAKDRELYCLEIQGQAFLWHMVRCIMAILFYIGREVEEPTIIEEFFDVENCYVAKPQYAPAPEFPLVLHDCHFLRLSFYYRPSVLYRLWMDLQASCSEAAIRLARLSNQLQFISSLPVAWDEFQSWMVSSPFLKNQDGSQDNKKKRKRRPDKAGAAVGEEEEEEKGMGGEDPPILFTWMEALKLLEAQDKLPASCLLLQGGGVEGLRRHIPLSQRSVGKTYEATVAEMRGKKKALYEHSQRKREEGFKTTDRSFFQRLRGELSISGSRDRKVEEEIPPN